MFVTSASFVFLHKMSCMAQGGCISLVCMVSKHSLQVGTFAWFAVSEACLTKAAHSEVSKAFPEEPEPALRPLAGVH